MRTTRQGFTLIELLVVVAIIAILAAILFPVFANAMEKAKCNTCLSNQRQLASAILMRAQDEDEMFPKASQVWSNIKVAPKLLICPAAKEKVPNHYVYNFDVAGMPVGALDNPATTGLTQDGLHDATKANLPKGLFDTYDNVAYSRSDIQLRHHGRAVVSYTDGHVALTQASSDGAEWQNLLRCSEAPNNKSSLVTPVAIYGGNPAIAEGNAMIAEGCTGSIGIKPTVNSLHTLALVPLAYLESEIAKNNGNREATIVKLFAISGTVPNYTIGMTKGVAVYKDSSGCANIFVNGSAINTSSITGMATGAADVFPNPDPTTYLRQSVGASLRNNTYETLQRNSKGNIEVLMANCLWFRTKEQFEGPLAIILRFSGSPIMDSRMTLTPLPYATKDPSPDNASNNTPNSMKVIWEWDIANKQ